jgi:hypothetical protein
MVSKVVEGGSVRMAQTKRKKKSPKSRARSTRSTRNSRGRATAKRQSSAQSRTKRAPSKTVLKQMAKDWDHVT